MRAAFLLVSLCIAVPFVQAGEAPADWILRTVKAYSALSYEGTFVYQKNDSLETMQVIHSPEKEGQTRLVALNGEMNEIHRRGGQMTRYLPERGLMIEGLRWSNPFFSAQPEDMGRLTAHYSLELGPADRVAGRACQRLRVRPRDGYRYGYRLCVDRETGLILHAQMIGEDDRIRQEVMFTALTVKDRIDPRLLAPAVDVSKLKREIVKTNADAARTMDVRHWDVPDPPSGYRLVFGADHVVPGGGGQEHLVYSDGLSAISVFIDAGPVRGKPIVGQTSRGSMNAYGDVRDGHQVLVVGEVPYAALKAMADSLHRRR
jgi:sigma-E factor negative regulatory protein RseB